MYHVLSSSAFSLLRSQGGYTKGRVRVQPWMSHQFIGFVTLLKGTW